MAVGFAASYARMVEGLSVGLHEHLPKAVVKAEIGVCGEGGPTAHRWPAFLTFETCNTSSVCKGVSEDHGE